MATNKQFNDEVGLSDEYLAVMRQVVQEELARGGTGKPQGEGLENAQVASDGSIKVNLWGKAHEFKSDADMQAFMERYMEVALEEAKKTGAPPPQQQVQPQQPQRPRVDVNKYVEMMAQDPYEAQRYMNQTLYGVPDPVALMAQRLQQLEAQQQQNQLVSVTEKFRQTTEDFPGNDPQAGLALANTVQRLGIPPTPEGLQAAWAYVKATGGYQPQGGGQQPQSGEMSFGGGGNSRQGIPFAGGGSSPGYDPVFDQFSNMSTEQMESTLRRLDRSGSR